MNNSLSEWRKRTHGRSFLPVATFVMVVAMAILAHPLDAAQSPRGAETFPKLSRKTKAPALPSAQSVIMNLSPLTTDTNLYMLSIKKTNVNNIHLAWTGPTGTVFQLTSKTNVNQSTWTTIGPETTNRSTVIPAPLRFTFYKVRTATSPVVPGQVQWIRDLIGRGGTIDSKGVACDSSGNVVVCGYYTLGIDCGGGNMTNTGQADGFIAKYNSQNGFLWSKRYSGGADEVAQSVTVDSLNNIIVTGSFYGTVDFGGTSLTSAGQSDIFIVKYTPAGTLVWAKRFGALAQDTGFAVTTDTNNNILLAVQFTFTVDFGNGPLVNPSQNFAVVKLNPIGTALWSKRWGTALFDTPSSINVDRSGDVLVAGQSYGPTDIGGGLTTSGGAFIAKYSGANGNHVWSKVIGGTSTFGVTSDPNSGNVVITGDAAGTVNFGSGSTTYNQPTMFLVGYSSTGTLLWSKVFTTTLFTGTSGGGVTMDQSGALAMSGRASGAVNFGGGSVICGGFCAVRFNISGNNAPVYQWALTATGSGGSNSRTIAFDGIGHVVAAGQFSSATSFGGTVVTPPNGGTDGFVIQLNK